MEREGDNNNNNNENNNENNDDEYEFEFEEYEGEDNANESLIKIDELDVDDNNDNNVNDIINKNENANEVNDNKDENGNEIDNNDNIESKKDSINDEKLIEINKEEKKKVSKENDKASKIDSNDEDKQIDDHHEDSSKNPTIKKIIIQDNKTDLKKEYDGDFISNIDKISVNESEGGLAEVELDDVIHRLKCSDRNVSNQKVVINGTIGLNIEECEVKNQEEETVKSEISSNNSKDNHGSMIAETVESLSTTKGLNEIQEKNTLSYEFMDNSNIVDTLVQNVSISDYLNKDDNSTSSIK
eukprot:jgi/Orpsp1_1/1177295/evm.model.c7180000060847.1